MSVNSFGYGGTNAHAIVEAYQPAPLANGHVNGNNLINGNGHVNGNGLVNGNDNNHSSKEKLVVLSANSETSLKNLISNMRDWLTSVQGQSASFTDLAYTLNVRRSKLPWRCSIVSSNSQKLQEALEDAKLRLIKSARDVSLTFVFTGQGAQWFAMGRELLTSSREFTSSIAICSRTMKALGCEWDLVEELSQDEQSSRLGESRFSQPTTTAVQIALVDLLATYGIRPEAVFGHSSGEIAAAYSAGALTRESAIQVAYMRGICSAEAKTLNSTTGGMLAVGEGEDAINKRIKQLDSNNGRVTVACVNSPESTTISGDVAAITELQAVLKAASVFNRRLKVDSAYHSHHMEIVAQSYLSSLDSLTHGIPRDDIAFFSSVTGARKRSDFGPSYWVSNLVSQVKFSAASQLAAQYLSDAYSTANNVLMEVGPHSALSGPLRQSLTNFKLASGASFKYSYIPCLVRNESAVSSVLALTGRVFELGGPVQLAAVVNMDEEKSSSGSRCRIVQNLPSYPWDYTATYWHESRLSKGNRLRSFSPHELLGLFDVASSPYEPRWRYHVSLESLPWLRDHIVEGFVIFPGAGYLVMVIEAMKQLFQLRNTPGRIRNINFRDATFAKPVVVHDDGAKGSREVELQLIISPSRQHVGSPWEYFRVLSYDSQNDSWVDNCSGLVSWDFVAVETSAQPQGDEFVGARDDDLGHLTKSAADEWLHDVRAVCPTSVDVTETYQSLKTSGNEYGPTFQGLKEIHVGKSYGFAKIVIDDIMQQIPGHYMQPHTIHPSTFDSIIQLEAVCFRREGPMAPIMPVMLGEVSVAVDVDSTPGTEIVVALQHFQTTPRDATAKFCAYQKQSDGTFRPVVTGFDVQTQAVGDADPGHEQKKTNYRMAWKPDVNYITQEDFMAHASRYKLFDVDYGKTSDQLAEVQLHLNDTVATIFIHKALQRNKEEGVSTACSPHLSKLLSWMTKWDETKAAIFLKGITPEDETKMIEQAAKSNIIGLALSRLGPQYVDLFTGKADTVKILAQDNLLSRVYSEYTLFKSHYTQMAEYMQTLVHKNPYMKILIVGTGNGDNTLPLMETMERNNRLPADDYTYIDISSDSLEQARTTFSKWAAQIKFKTLDISRDPLAQGFTAHSFDLVIAPAVLHATPLIDVAVASVRKLLKSGGRLMLMELTAAAAAHNAIFSTLDSWWQSEDERRDGPLLTVREWQECLKRHGFSGTDLAIPAHRGCSSDISTMIVAQAVSGEPVECQKVDNMAASVILHLGCCDEALQVALGADICHSLCHNGIKCHQEAWSTKAATAQDPNNLAIVIDSVDHPLLLEPSHETFEQIKQLLLQGRNILWASFQSSPPSGEKAALSNMVNGMARVVRRENPGLRLITVDVQDLIHPSSNDHKLHHIVQTLTKIAMSSFWSPEGVRADEYEYTIRDGKLTIPRVIPDDLFAKYIDSQNPDQDKSGDTPLVECRYINKNRPLKFDVRVPGLLNTIRFVDNDEMLKPLRSDEVEVQARAHGLNFKDVFIALGQMAPGTPMTGEVAGVITAVGSNVQSWKLGDRVVGLMVAQFGNQVRINYKNVVAIPDSVTFADAASIPWVYFTAWYCLNYVARIEKGQSVLIHAGSGGVGQSAIQLAKLIGAEIFTTVGSIAKKKLIQEQYGIPDSHIFSSHSGQFKKHILASTQGKGVDVVLNSFSGQLLRDSWDCVAPFGTFCEIGKADILGRSQLNMANFEKQATFASVDASFMYRQRPESVIRGVKEIFIMVEQGLLRPVYPVTTFDMARIEEPFRLISARKHVGKLVLVADEQTTVQATRPKAPALQLQREGTYIIGGGLGDLGKRMGRFLAEKGAGHIVALTRQDVNAVTQQPAVLEVREAISKLGATFQIFQCDISDKNSARSAAEKIAYLGLPPVRGIIQSTLVLRDHPLEFMEVEDWKTAMRPKVQGTLNMHEAFCSPETTDFFIMLSSVASIIGSGSQSNYAAGNAFQDAFAHAQRQYPHGITNFVTINVGAVEGSEQIARALDQKSEIIRIIGSVSFDDVLATLEYAMGPQARVDEVEQFLMHFDRDTMEDAVGTTALSDHLYDHVPSKRRHGDKTANNGGADGKKQSTAQAVEQAETVAEAEEIVRVALHEKFTAFVGDDIPDVPIAALGLDSLVSIELKNWVKYTFQTPLQISELSGARSIVALAKLIASRMNLKCRANGASPDDEAQPAGDVTGIQMESQTAALTNGNAIPRKLGHAQNCCRLHKEVPAQPLPDLDDTLDYWLEANEHLFSPQQLESIHRDIHAMRAPESTARQILRDLYSTHGHDKTNGWFSDIVTDARFLCSRAPIAPWTSIMGGQRDNRGKRHSQVERAAIITSAALSFKRAMNMGEVEPLEIAGRPECTWRWGWLFNSTRVPQLKCDKMVSYASSDEQNARDHIAVLRKGHVFKVMLQNENGTDVTSEQLQATFEVIVARVAGNDVWSGLLTTDERDSWAKVGEHWSPFTHSRVLNANEFTTDKRNFIGIESW